MNKLIFFLLLALIPGIGKAQKNFEGEIAFKMYRLDKVTKDTIFGDPYRFIISGKAIKVERFTKNGALFQTVIVYLDSLKSIEMDNRYHAYWNAWKGPAKHTELPWGMEKTQVVRANEKILGYNTFINRLTTAKPADGHVEMYEATGLFFKLSPQVGNGLFLDEMLFYNHHIMLKSSVTAGVSPYTQVVYIATSVKARKTNPSEFAIPAGYSLTTVQQFNKDVASGKLTPAF